MHEGIKKEIYEGNRVKKNPFGSGGPIPQQGPKAGDKNSDLRNGAIQRRIARMSAMKNKKNAKKSDAESRDGHAANS